MLGTILLLFLLLFGGLAFLLTTLTSNGKEAKAAQSTLQAALKLPAWARKDDFVDIRKNTTLSSLPWLNALLEKVRSFTELRLLLEQAEVNWTPSRLVLTATTAWAIGSFVIQMRTHGGLISALLGLPFGAAPFLYVRFKRSRRFHKFEQALPEALDLMASALRGGHSMISALGIVANEAPDPINRELKICFEEQNFGIDLRTALENLTHRVPLQDLRLVATAMLIQKENGGNLAEVIEKTAAVIRDRFRLLQQIRVHTAQGRLTGWILSGLPIAVGIIMSLVNPDHIKLLLNTSAGHKMIWAGSAMNLVGLLIIQKIVRIKV